MSRRAALLFLLSLAMLAASLVAAEFAARFVFREALSKHPRISTNRLGFRERRIDPKDPARYRIAVIGDSFTFGDGIEEHDRFSNLVQDLAGPGYEVLNFGTRAHNLPDHVRTLERVLKLDPDFVLLQLYENDFETPSMDRPEAYPIWSAQVDRRMVRSVVMYRLLKDSWVKIQQILGLSEEYSAYMGRHLRDPNSPHAQESFGRLRQFIERTKSAGVPSGAVLFPALWALRPGGAGYPFDYLHERVGTICTEEQITCLDLFSAFVDMGDARSLWVSAFDAHPNARANRRAAFEILNAFGPAWHR